MKTKKLNSAQEFIAVEDIKDNCLYSLSGYIFAYIWVKAKDANLLSEDDKLRYYKNIGIAFESEKEPWQIISVPRVVDTSDLIDNLLKLRRNTNNTAKLNLLTQEIAALQEMARTGLKEPLIFLKIWMKKSKNALSELVKRQNVFITKLNERGVQASAFSNTDITYICKLYAELGQHHNKDDENNLCASMPKLKKQKNAKVALEDERKQLQREKINMITPCAAITFKPNKIVIGTMIAKAYFANSYPATLDYDWAVRIMNCTEAITCITFNSSNANELADALSRSIKQNAREAVETGDARAQKSFTRAADDADKLISSLDEDGETVGNLSILVLPFCENEEELNEVSRRVISGFAVNRIKLRQLGQLQKEAFETVSPYRIPNNTIMAMSQRVVPLTTLIGGSPMTVNIFKDDNGFYFSVTTDGNIISIDFSKRGGDRTNSNLVITGKPGTGKSTTIKSILETMYMSGWKIIIIDPESEYKDLCINLNGSWLDAGGGQAKINVFQIRAVPFDDDETEKSALYSSDDLPLVNHIKTLEAFLYTYIPSLNDIQKSLLKKAIVELYADFGITWDTDVTAFSNTDFPIFTDLYKLLKSKIEIDARYEDVACLFYDIAEGSDSFLWNGYTNINVSNDFICFDTNKLSGAANKIVCAQYFNLLTQSWQLMCDNKNEKVILVCDEAYQIVDPNVPQGLMLMRNISKRCRKRNAALAVISHSLVDFLDEKIRMYGQALLENPSYKLFFGTDGQNLKETTDLYGLSEAEQGILQAGIRGEALAFIGTSRMKVRFTLPQYRLELMGKAGGS